MANKPFNAKLKIVKKGKKGAPPVPPVPPAKETPKKGLPVDKKKKKV